MERLSTSTLRAVYRIPRVCVPARAISGRPRTSQLFRHPTPPPPPPPPPTPAVRIFAQPATTPGAVAEKEKSERSRIERRPTNRQIPFEHVFVVDPTTNKLSPTKQSLRELLETRQRKVVELVAAAPEPIVRITTRGEVEARYREMKTALKKGTKVGEEPKEIQLTWGVAKADLEHKLRKARRDIEKGYRVVVVVAMKNGRNSLTRQQMIPFADEISEAVRDVGEEWKEREFTRRMMILSFRKLGKPVDQTA